MKAVSKDYWREIKNTKSRFFSILILVALAVAFLSGLRATAPDMKMTGHNYVESLKLADMQIISTLGITEEDYQAVKQRPEVESAEAVYVIDAFCVSSTTDLVSKVYSIPEEDISNIILISGRMPSAANECLVEDLALGELNIKLGDTVEIYSEGNYEDSLKERNYKVVGTVRSPIYLSVERGSATIGTGSVREYIYIPKDSFDMDYYTNIFIRLKGTDGLIAFSEEYNDFVSDAMDSMKSFAEERASLRAEELIAEANITLDEKQEELEAAKLDAEAELEEAQAKLDSAKVQLEVAQIQLDAGWDEYNASYTSYTLIKTVFDELTKSIESEAKKYDINSIIYRRLMARLDEKRAEVEEGAKQLADARALLNRSQKEYDEGLAEYEQGVLDFEAAKLDAEEKIASAQAELDKARTDLRDAIHGEWYLFDRSYNPGYSGLGQDADRMANLANVFPLLFFLVAALVCLTTMTRMVEEERIQIGGMKALGYKAFRISLKYVGYGFIPSVIGSAVGLVVGFTLFPSMIFTAYQIMYQMPNIELHTYLNTSVLCTLAAIACTTLSSLWACLATLRETPANLMRPKTPPAGKRVFLEYIKPVWKRMSFIHKVTARNLFRYQKRFWMTVIGIAGCTALIIAGLGLRSSLTFTMHRQYEQLFHYNAMVSMSSDATAEELKEAEDFFENDSRITSYEPVKMLSCTARSDKGGQTAYLYVVDSARISEYADIYDYESGETIVLEDNGVYIDQKLSELLAVGIGDKIFIDAENKEYATVAGIFEHYTGHFIYMTPEYYEKIFEEESKTNGYFLSFTSDDADFCDGIFEDFMNLDGILGTQRVSDIQDTYLKSMERIDFVVIIIILCSGALALIVLYNLSNINISERLRELATIKVLGFYDNEVSAYVYRENVVLTIFGILLGLLFGHNLHTWLVKSVEIDLMMFGRETDPKAYLWATLLTVIFAIIANLMAHFKMKKIDMVESLKSAE